MQTSICNLEDRVWLNGTVARSRPAVSSQWQKRSTFPFTEERGSEITKEITGPILSAAASTADITVAPLKPEFFSCTLTCRSGTRGHWGGWQSPLTSTEKKGFLHLGRIFFFFSKGCLFSVIYLNFWRARTETRLALLSTNSSDYCPSCTRSFCCSWE